MINFSAFTNNIRYEKIFVDFFRKLNLLFPNLIKNLKFKIFECIKICTFIQTLLCVFVCTFYLQGDPSHYFSNAFISHLFQMKIFLCINFYLLMFKFNKVLKMYINFTFFIQPFIARYITQVFYACRFVSRLKTYML